MKTKLHMNTQVAEDPQAVPASYESWQQQQAHKDFPAYLIIDWPGQTPTESLQAKCAQQS